MDRYIFSQFFVIISSVFLGISYFSKQKKQIMMLCVIYCIFYSIHYFLLCAYTGMFMSFISAFRNVWFYFTARKNTDNKLCTLLFFACSSVFFGIYSYQDCFSTILIFANIVSTYSIWQSNTNKYRTLAIPVSICFVVYSIHINSLFSVIMELALLLVEIASIIEINYKKNNEIIRSDIYE